MLLAEDSLWIWQAPDVREGGVLIRIDPRTNGILARIPVTAIPIWEGAGIEAGGGSIWLAGIGEVPGAGFGAILQRIDPVTNEVVATVPLDGEVGYDVALDGSVVWAMFGGHDGYTRVARIDPPTMRLTATVALEHQWAHWIRPTDAGLLVLEHQTSGGSGRQGVFTLIDRATGEVVSTSEPDLRGSAWGLGVWDGQVWTDAGGWELARIDPATGGVLGTARPALAISGSEGGLVVGEGGIWFVGYNPNTSNQRPLTLNRLNPETGAIDVSAEIGTRGVALAAGGGAIWLLVGDGTLLRFNLKPPPAQPEPEALKLFVAPLVARFMEARVDGFGAERFLSDTGVRAWSSATAGLMSLYSPEGLRYESFAITGVDLLGDGTFQVGVRTFGAHLDGQDEWFTEPLFEETLLVGPGKDPCGQAKLLLVAGGHNGLQRPDPREVGGR